MNAMIVRRIAAATGGAAVVAAVVVGCGATVHVAEPGSTAPDPTTESAAPTVGEDDGGGAGQVFSGPIKLEEPPEDQNSPETAVQIAPGEDGGAGPSEVIRSGESAAPPTIETPAPPTGGGKGGH